MMPRTTPALQDERFLLLETLGHGGMASVFRAFDRVEQRVVALKAPADTDRAGPSNPLSTEFEVWSRLQHPNVVQAYELGTARTGPLTPGAPYLVIEHVRGGPLNRVLRVGREAPAAIEDVAVQLLRGLGHVHDAGLVHRDLKPGNVLVRVGRRGSAQVKLTDFGLAVNRGLQGEAGTISGSLPFVAPEVLLGRPLDGRADLYGLGILLYHLATGEMPARSRKVDDLMRWHLAGPPADPRRARPRFPGRLARFIARLTARMPEQRPSDCAEALSLLGAGRRWASPPRPGALCRGLRARLRLAMDAARLGARRLFVLPRGRASSRELERQAGVWSQIHGLLFHRLDAPAGTDPSPLSRLVLRLLLERSAESSTLVARHALDRWFPLKLVAGVPLWDRTLETSTLSRDERILAHAASRLGSFLLDCSARRSLVIHVARDAAGDPLARQLIEQMISSFDPPAPDATRGGFLLMVDEAFSSATRRGRPSRG
jgi:serine/threonine protein kinase